MDFASTARLLALAAIWGSSFLLMRWAVPALGPVWMIEARVALAALFLFVVSLWVGRRLHWRQNWRHYLVLGSLNSALPFLLFGVASRTLSVALMAILNATAPIWAAAITAAWMRQAPAPRVALGLGLGLAGVALLVGFSVEVWQTAAWLEVLAGLGAAGCYGLASIYARFAARTDPLASAQGAMWVATLLIAPALGFIEQPQTLGWDSLGAVAVLGVVCSGVAYLLFFRLIADIGPASALTVSFLIPVFGVFWGWLFLGETLTWQGWLGMGTVAVGTALVTGFSPWTLVRTRRQGHADI